MTGHIRHVRRTGYPYSYRLGVFVFTWHTKKMAHNSTAGVSQQVGQFLVVAVDCLIDGTLVSAAER